MACSIGRVTRSYTSCGAAPGYGVTMATMGIETSGMVSRFRLPPEYSPPNNTSRAVMMMTVGFFRLKRVMRSILFPSDMMNRAPSVFSYW
jgi:hypothetical protein